MERDMTVGTPWKIILNFTIPIVIGNIFQQFYSMVDTVIVGKFVGTKALAAVGSTGTIGFLILGFLMGLTAGFTADQSAIRCRRYAGDAKDGRICGSTFGDRQRGDDGDQYGVYEASADSYEYTGRYFSRCV